MKPNKMLPVTSLENREYGLKDPSRWSRGTLYPQKLVTILLTSDGRSVGVVRSRTQAKELVFFFSFMSAEHDPKQLVHVSKSIIIILQIAL
jgi:hypothetical protein